MKLRHIKRFDLITTLKAFTYYGLIPEVKSINDVKWYAEKLWEWLTPVVLYLYLVALKMLALLLFPISYPVFVLCLARERRKARLRFLKSAREDRDYCLRNGRGSPEMMQKAIDKYKERIRQYKD